MSRPPAVAYFDSAARYLCARARACVCAFARVRVRACVHVRACACARKRRVRARACARAGAHVRARMCVRARACVHARVRVRVFVCVRARACVRAFVRALARLRGDVTWSCRPSATPAPAVAMQCSARAAVAAHRARAALRGYGARRLARRPAVSTRGTQGAIALILRAATGNSIPRTRPQPCPRGRAA
jgi:hypothetical protein